MALSDEEFLGSTPGTPTPLSDEQFLGPAAGKPLSDQEFLGTPPEGSMLKQIGKSLLQSSAGLIAGELEGIAGGRAAQPSFLQGQSPIEQAMRGDPSYAETFNQGPTGPPRPITEDPTYQAGKALRSATTFTPEPGYEGKNNWTTALSSGAGSMLAGLGLAAINPGLAATTFITAGMGEATQNAVEAGATPEQIQTAARWGAPVGATDLFDLAIPGIGRITKGMLKAILTGAAGEALQEGTQQFLQNVIAKGIYKPSQDLMEDVVFNAAVGGILGGGAGAVAHRIAPHDAPATPIDPQAVHRILTQYIATPEGNRVATPGPMAPATPIITSETEAPKSTPIELPMEDRPLTPVQSPIFYSQLAKVAEEKLPDTASPEQIMATLRNAPGVKQEELQQTGVEAFLASQQGKVSKADLLAHLEENATQVSEVLNAGKEVWRIENERGYRVSRNQYDSKEQAEAAAATLTGRFGPLRTVSELLPGATQYEAYATPGGRNYRELLLTLPKRDAGPSGPIGWATTAGGTVSENDYYGAHWREANVLAHVRFTDRHDPAGRPMLHIEEIQSDWQQAGRKFGYKGRSDAEIHAEHRALTREFDSSGVAGSPRGREIVDRLRELTDELRSNIRAVPNAPFKTTWPELAIKRMIRWAADNGYSRISWSNGELAAQYSAGGTTDPAHIAGLNEFYDKIIPSIMRKWAKKLGGVIGATDLPFTRAAGILRRALGGMQRVYFLEIPEAAKTYIQRGLPLFDKPLTAHSDVTTFRRDTFKAQATPAMKDAVGKISAAFQEFVAKFGISKDVLLDIQWNKGGGLLSYPGAFGVFEPHVNGYVIRINAEMFEGNIASMYSTLMHEFGHMVVHDKFHLLPDAAKQAIRQAHADYLGSLGQDPDVLNMLRRRQSAPRAATYGPATELSYSMMRVADLSQDRINYHLGFNEWIADQVARWATTSDEAVGIVDKHLNGVGKALRFFYEWMATKLGLEFRPTLDIQNWLNSYLSSAPPMTIAEYDALDVRTQRANLRIVEPNVPMPPQQPAIQPIRNAVNQAHNGATPLPVQQMAAHADRINKFYAWMAGLLELAQANRFFTPLMQYVEGVSAMHREEAKIQDAAVRITKDWRRLGKQSENLTAFFEDMTNMKYLTPQEVQRGVVRQPTQQEVAQLLARHRLNSRAQEVIGKVQHFFQTFLRLVAQNAKDDALRLISDPVSRAQRIDEINAQITNLQRRPYFPFMRFGSHFVTVKDANGKVLWFETFERSGLRPAEKKQMARVRELQQQYGVSAVSHGILPEHSEMLVGMPSTLLQHMRDRLQLTPAQLDAFEQLQFELSPSLSFKHRFQHKAFTPGYSRDFARSFARYAFTGARYYSRTKYAWWLQDRIKDARKVMGNKAGAIANYMDDHLQNTVLDARGDYGIFKGGIFLWAMGYVPAAATQNLTQTPLITYPWLASKFGDVRTGKAMVNAMRKLNSFYRRGHYENATEFEMQALSYGIRTGRISETQAPELAGLSAGSNLLYGAGGNPLQRTAIWLQEHGAAMFEAAEQFNRRIAYRATLELAMNNPTAAIVREAVSRYQSEYQSLTQGQRFTPQQAAAIVTANHAVETTQFVYARYARPRFMRGKVAGTVFVFKRYIQSVLMLFLNGDKGYRIRFLLAAMLMGGMGGVPGYEELKALVTAGLRLLGYGDDAEVEVRRYIKAFAGETIPPDLVLHGLARRGFGVPALLDLMGSLYTGQPGRGLLLPGPGKNFPFPMLDRSKAISPGPIIPGLGLINGSDSVDKTIADETQKASGAVFGVGFNLFRAMSDNHLAITDPKRWERAIPRLLADVSKQYRAFSEGRERTRGGPSGGSTVVSYDIHDPEQMMEAIALGLGYNNLRTTSQWDTVMAVQEHKKYIDMKRTGILEQFFEAQQSGQERQLETVREAVQKFNTDVRGTDDAAKAITPEAIIASIEKRVLEKNARETGVPTRKTDIPSARAIQGLFPENVIDAKRR